MNILPNEFNPVVLKEKYGDTFDDAKYREASKKKEAELKKKKGIMMHGKKKYAEIVAKGKKAKEKIKDPRGIKFKDKKGEGYMKGGKKTYA